MKELLSPDAIWDLGPDLAYEERCLDALDAVPSERARRHAKRRVSARRHQSR